MLIFLAFQMQGQMTVNTFANSTHLGGTLTVEETHTFPDDVSGYEQVIMKIALTCPAGGCDPWDRYSHIQIKHEGETYEIGRYITPYANNWCSWELDVTPYKNMLSGEVDMISYIETYQNGWNLTVDFDFIAGTPEYEYMDVQNLYVNYNRRYGDTIAFVNDLDAVEAMIDANAEKVWLRMNITGHGQGNTENAAEFSQKTHHLNVDGTDAFDHYLWKDDCNINPCSPQSGTWMFARAGWCPGQEVAPTDFDITSLTTPGDAVLLDYRLDSYYNQCSPWNPDCVDGATCADCLYNSTGHTEPNYKIVMQLIQFSNSEFSVGVAQTESIDFKIWPVPGNGIFNLQAYLPSVPIKTVLTDIEGRIIDQPSFDDTYLQTQLNYSHLSPGVYTLSIIGEDYTVNRKLIIQ